MVDVVANHMGDGDISTFSPFSNESFYHDCSGCPSGERAHSSGVAGCAASLYHHPCPASPPPPGCNVADYTNEPQMEHCRLAGLLDLNQTDAQSGPATGLLLDWIHDLVQVSGKTEAPAGLWPRGLLA